MEEHKDEGEHHNKAIKKSESITMDKVTLWKIIAGILGVLLVISIFTSGFGIRSDLAAAKEQPAQPRDDPSPDGSAVDMAELIDDDTVKGEGDAPVTIVEWSDFECPFCARFHAQAYQDIKKEYIDTGKVKMVYRDFPLGFHKNAQKAAEAAECAGEQGRFWEMHDKLFEEGVDGGVDSFRQFADDIGLDTAEFNECLDSGAMAPEVAEDMQEGQALGIKGTPGFIINGQLVTGAQPFSVFQEVIEAELARVNA